MNPIVIGGSVSGFFFVLIIILIWVLCRRYNNEKRAYNKDFLQSQVIRDKFHEGTLVLSGQNFIDPEFTYKASTVPVTPANDYTLPNDTTTPNTMNKFRSISNQEMIEQKRLRFQTEVFSRSICI